METYSNISPEQKTEDSPKVVLLVDDNALMLRTMKMMLQDRYRVLLATSGPGCLAAIERERPDVILLDYDMPECDGKMTLEMLRAKDETRNIPVLMLTGITDSSKIKSILALQPKGYLLKPPKREKILAALEECFYK